MRMVPPLRGACASAVADSASAKPATIAIFFNIVLSPTMQEYPRRRVDHPQHAERKVLVRADRDRDDIFCRLYLDVGCGRRSDAPTDRMLRRETTCPPSSA